MSEWPVRGAWLIPHPWGSPSLCSLLCHETVGSGGGRFWTAARLEVSSPHRMAMDLGEPCQTQLTVMARCLLNLTMQESPHPESQSSVLRPGWRYRCGRECTHVHTCTRIHARARTCTHTNMHTHIHTCAYTHVHMCVHSHTRAHTRTCTYTHTCTHAHKQTYTHAYMYTCSNSHTRPG